MILFGQTFFTVLIVCALGLTAVGALTLIILLIRDFMKDEVW